MTNYLSFKEAGISGSYTGRALALTPEIPNSANFPGAQSPVLCPMLRHVPIGRSHREFPHRRGGRASGARDRRAAGKNIGRSAATSDTFAVIPHLMTATLSIRVIYLVTCVCSSKAGSLLPALGWPETKNPVIW
jgi:hypothetical protein